jgi:single-strand DNA-binding protein
MYGSRLSLNQQRGLTMSSCFNGYFIGNLGSDPEVKTLDGGSKVAKFSVSESQYQGKDKENKSVWHQCEAWGNAADFVEKYLKSGSKVHVIFNRYKTEAWTNKDGEAKSKTVFIAETVNGLDKKES